ncbi:MAG TPA: hypothetical protein VF026_11265 [Ktedonobacteraceae bacterium]
MVARVLFTWTHLLEEHDYNPNRGRPLRPSHPPPTALAPTERPASRLTSWPSFLLDNKRSYMI